MPGRAHLVRDDVEHGILQHSLKGVSAGHRIHVADGCESVQALRYSSSDARGILAEKDLVEKLIAGHDAWNRYLPNMPNFDIFDFSGADLSSIKELKNYEFSKHVDFSQCKFGDIVISDSKFRSGAKFKGARFNGTTALHWNENARPKLDFSEATFTGKTVISAGTDGLIFKAAVFEGELYVQGSFYGGSVVDFSSAVFHHGLSTNQIGFGGPVTFRSATHRGHDQSAFSLRSCKFQSTADFEGFRFEGEADFSRTQFSGRTSFRRAVFQRAPLFHDAKLYPETEFDPVEAFDRQFPDVASADSESRYRTLKFLMIGQQALAEQQGFGRLELKARSRRSRLWWLSMLGAYEIFSDYGLSWLGPLLWLFAALLAQWGLLWSLTSPTRLFLDPELSALALANAVPYITSLKSFGADQMKTLFGSNHLFAAEVVTMVFGVVSILLQFLIALGVRNKLRLK